MKSTSRRRPGRPHLRLEALEGRALLAGAGALDPSFGGGYGYATLSLGLPTLPPTTNYVDGATSVIPETNGQILVVGTVTEGTQAEAALARFNADGSVDTTFGVGGQVRLPISTGLNNKQAFSATVQADGKILVVTDAKDGGGNLTYVVARLDVNGSLDTTYGTNGVSEYPASTSTPVADRLGQVISVLAQADGSLILAGTTDPTASTTSFAAVRLDMNGSLDTTYGTAGTETLPVTVNNITQNTLADAVIQADGSVLLVGEVGVDTISNGGGLMGTALDLAVIKLDTDGALDPTYGGSTASGEVLIPPPGGGSGDNTATAAALDPTDGKLVISGLLQTDASATHPTLYRLNTDGTLDTTFGTGGVTTTLIGNGSLGNVLPANATNGGLAVQSDGKILEAGDYGNLGSVVGRFNTDGTIDTTFGNSSTFGLARAPVKGTLRQALAIQADGNILLASIGTLPSLAGQTYGFAVSRFLATPSTGTPVLPPPPIPPADFGGAGYTNAAVYDPGSASFLYQQVATGGSLVTVPFGSPGVGQSIPAVADYEGIGSPQLAVYLPTLGIYAIRPSSGPDEYIALGTSGTGQTIPVPADYEGTGKADVAVYLTASGSYAILPSTGGPGRTVQLGTPGIGQSIPAPADYYGTGQADLAVYLEAQGAFLIQPPTGGPAQTVSFGTPGLGVTIPVPGDYDGSGHIELAVYIPSYGEFIYRPFKAGSADVVIPFGTPGVGELPVVGDYDGSGRTEVAVYDPSRGFIAYRPANGGPDVITYIGSPNNGSIPVAAPSGALPEFSGSGSGGGSAHALTIGSTGASTSSASVTPSRSAGVPAGPTLASFRVARTLVNQAKPDPWERGS